MKKFIPDPSRILKRAPELQKHLNEHSMQVFGRVQDGEHCIQCGKVPEGFSDEMSENDFYIVGMCQPCQDSFYAGVADDE
jgi:uncharacterized CHY-type Zn-finger protein